LEPPLSGGGCPQRAPKILGSQEPQILVGGCTQKISPSPQRPSLKGERPNVVPPWGGPKTNLKRLNGGPKTLVNNAPKRSLENPPRKGGFLQRKGVPPFNGPKREPKVLNPPAFFPQKEGSPLREPPLPPLKWEKMKKCVSVPFPRNIGKGTKC